MTKLIPLTSIPTAAARRAESAARKSHQSRDAALQAATYRIVSAPGCYSGLEPTLGWVLTAAAAESIAAAQTRMPGGTTHCRRAYRYEPEMGA